MQRQRVDVQIQSQILDVFHLPHGAVDLQFGTDCRVAPQRMVLGSVYTAIYSASSWCAIRTGLSAAAWTRFEAVRVLPSKLAKERVYSGIAIGGMTMAESRDVVLDSLGVWFKFWGKPSIRRKVDCFYIEQCLTHEGVDNKIRHVIEGVQWRVHENWW